jgi:uncharacterized protein
MAKKMNPVVWFEIPVTDMERAKKFYKSVLGTKLTDGEMGAMKLAFFPMLEALGSAGALVKGKGYKPSHAGTLVYFSAPNIKGTLAKVASGGGKTLLPKTSIGEWGFVAHFEDTEGNRLGLHSMK